MVGKMTKENEQESRESRHRMVGRVFSKSLLSIYLWKTNHLFKVVVVGATATDELATLIVRIVITRTGAIVFVSFLARNKPEARSFL
uniref:Uncharacterized protein n=1 Tax=Romanomermis culicivorax TaxID=13658 RepID=A0A915L7P7_ROMCU